jgi:tRNA 5-methylaminomethyl-2-thiouridine biosynthesis bifunctional protein
VVLETWAPETTRARVAALRSDADGWALLDAAGHVVGRADAVILAAGQASAGLSPGTPLQPVRGQASWAAVGDPPPAAAWGGYVLPMAGAVLFGATHDRGDEAADLRPQDHARNLATLGAALPALAARLAEAPLEGRASVRATTPDRLPLAGQAPGSPGLFLLTGFGSRGFALAPLLAEHVAALALGAPSPLAESLAALVEPGRFARRAARRPS